jgi:hypothetical protein
VRERVAAAGPEPETSDEVPAAEDAGADPADETSPGEDGP